MDSVEIKVHIIILIFHKRKLSFRQANQQIESEHKPKLQISKCKPLSTMSKLQRTDNLTDDF